MTKRETKVKAVKAWAVVPQSGNIVPFRIYIERDDAMYWKKLKPDLRVIHVEIRPLPRKRGKR